MKTYRHADPLSNDDLSAARSAVLAWKGAQGVEKTKIFRQHRAAIHFAEWAIRTGRVSESYFSEAQKPAPAKPSSKPQASGKVAAAQTPGVLRFEYQGKSRTPAELRQIFGSIRLRDWLKAGVKLVRN